MEKGTNRWFWGEKGPLVPVWQPILHRKHAKKMPNRSKNGTSAAKIRSFSPFVEVSPAAKLLCRTL
jgi:hypothetical protein